MALKMRGARGTLVVALALTCLLLLASVALSLGHQHRLGAERTPHASTSRPSVLPLGNVTPCSSLNSNGSLNETYLTIYEGVNNLSQNWTPGPNESQPANQSEYPNALTGEQQLDRAWTTICESLAYGTLYAEWGFNSSFSGFQLDPNGFYDVNFGFVYHASCNNSSRLPGPNQSSCEYFTTWYVNASSGVIVGPQTTPGYNVNTGPPPIPGDDGGTPLGSHSSRSGTPSHSTRTSGVPFQASLHATSSGGSGNAPYIALGVAVLAAAGLIGALLPRRRSP